MRSLLILLLLTFQGGVLFSQVFDFSYEGPDTLFVGDNCETVLDWGHPDQPTVISLIGAEIDSFYLYSISGDYELNEMVGAGQEIEITYKAVDNQGNAAFFSFFITFFDHTPPVIITPAQNAVYPCGTADITTLLENWYEQNASLTAADNCQAIITQDKSLSETLIAFNQSTNELCGNTKKVIVEFTVSDEAGNTLPPVIAEFKTVDHTDPVFTTNPQSLVAGCSEDIAQILEDWLDNLGGATATDECSQDLTWSFNWQDNAGNGSYEYIGNKPYDLQPVISLCTFTANISFIAEDACGNKEGKFATITINDDNSPVFSAEPPDTLVDCGMIGETPQLLANDPCKGELIVLFEENSNQSDDPASYSYYNYDVTQSWSADDGCGHEIMYSRLLSVRDTTRPDFVVPADITIGCLDILNTELTGVPTDISDNCSGSFTIDFVDLPSGTGCSYLIERTWKVTDISGNEKTHTQLLNIVDVLPPVISIEPADESISCESENDILNRYFDWLGSFGNAEFSDGCNEAFAFAAVPGSYDILDDSTFPGEYPGTDFLFSCANALEQTMYQQFVDFVFYDECGNTTVFTRAFRVQDEIFPVIQNCLSDTLIILDEGSCLANVAIPAFTALDNCTGLPWNLQYTQNFTINSAVPGDKNIPVDTIKMQIGPIDVKEQDIQNILNITLQFYNIDADDVNEYFVIRGEDGEILGTTPESDDECGDLVVELGDLIDIEQLQLWLTDGFLEITLEPFISPSGGVFSINDICGNSYVTTDLTLSLSPVSQLDYSLRINGIQVAEWDNSLLLDTTFSAGEYFLEYSVVDCGNNHSFCSATIQVVDQQAPEITCPSSFQATLASDTCKMEMELPFLNIGFSDNCVNQWTKKIKAPLNDEDSFISFSYDTDREEYIANNKNFIFEIAAPDELGMNPQLVIQAKGDMESLGEYFELLDEKGQVIGSTPMANCDSFTLKTIPLDPLLFNEWKSDGTITIVARSSIGTEVVNPCDPQVINFDGDSDGISSIRLEIQYESLSLYYFVEGNTEIPLKKYNHGIRPPKENFNGGKSTIFYVLEDLNDNRDTCSFEFELNDNQNPVAVCKQALAIFINPTGIEDYVLDPMELDDGSWDNCSIDSMSVHPSVFDCSMAGTTVEVSFYVWDQAGNVDSCMTSVKVETQALQPSYQAGVCAFDTLKLFANLPVAPPGIYSILWQKENNGFSSNEENPVRPNADASYSGTYSLEVTGLNGCSSNGFVEVFIEDLNTPVLNISRDTVCQGESILIGTTSYSGNVTYKWYKGLAPNGSLVDTTSVPELEIVPDIGKNRYYLVVVSKNCISPPSLNIEVDVLENPVASVIDPFISLCEGDDLQLGTNVTGPSFQYQWWGPDSYVSTNQNPQIISGVKIKNQGTYRLAVFNGICSDTAVVEVLVNEKPVTPVITGDQLYCEGENIILSISNITNADTYSWYLNTDLYTVQNTNTLVIPGAQALLSGEWTVQAKEGSCFSDTSSVHLVEVEIKYEISADNSGPVCQGDSVTLYAPGIPGASYSWESPGGVVNPAQNPVWLAENGLYRLEIITPAGCSLTTSTFVEVAEIPVITALSNSAPTCIDGDECIEFIPSVFPNLAGYQYEWSGPGNFVSNDSIAILCEADTSYNGIYRLLVSNGNCVSDTLYTSVSMVYNPPVPSLEGAAITCENDTIQIHLTNYVGESMEYYWSTPGGNNYQTGVPVLKIPHARADDSGKYTAFAFNGTCYSDVSDSLLVEVIPQPNQPGIWSDNSFCEGDPVHLFTQFVPFGEYFWEGPNGFTSQVQNPVIFPSDLLNEGIYRLKISVDGCYSEYSAGLPVEIGRKPDQPVVLENLPPLCADKSGSVLEICLQEQDANTGYKWYHNDSGTYLGEFFDKCIYLDDFSSFEDGSNNFYVIAYNKGCESEPSDPVEVIINYIPDKIAMAGEDIEACDDTDLHLNALPDPEGIWQDPLSGILLVNKNDPATRIMHLAEGKNTFVWSLSHGVCLDFDQDTVEVHIIESPKAFDDLYETLYSTPVDLDPAFNDAFGEGSTVTLTQLVNDAGEFQDLGNNQFRFIPYPTFIGNFSVEYKLAKDECPGKWDIGKIDIIVGDAEDCFGVNVITPNGDGTNDQLLFPCLETGLYSKNKLIVLNQWGDEVYRKSPYQNDWEGTYRGKDLPVGTYYYLLDLSNGSEPLRGFFVIER